MFWLLWIGVVVVTTLGAKLPKTGFSCEGRATGYYADVESGCQLYHMCDGLGRQFSYTCPNATLFQQRMLICDHWYMVNCSKSVDDYKANLRIGHREMPFVDDSESHPYHRTPRPDLLSQRSQSEYDIIYRTGRKQNRNNLNLVGVESDSKNSTTPTTDQPAYSLPSHWSTEYSQVKPVTFAKTNGLKKNVDGIIKGKPVVPINSVTDNPVNYKSQFKATTPVFPLEVEPTSEAPAALGLLPPLPYTTESPSLEISTNRVNYQSNFQATTPAFPTSVDITSEEPSDAGVLPPQDTSNKETKSVPSLNLNFEPPAVDPNPVNRSHENIEPSLPSKFYQPPKFQPDYTELSQASAVPNQNANINARSSEEWTELRHKFLVPDYEFPLESVSRPSYDTVFNSFQASETKSK